MCSAVWLPARVTLADGTDIDVRELYASDGPGVRVWFKTLSPEARYQRFHTPANDLSEVQWRYLTRVDGVQHVAIVALFAGAYVGVGRMIMLDDAGRTAEVAFLVDDAFQRRGLGAVLRDVLITAAEARAVERLYAWVLPDNIAIRRLLARARSRMIDNGDVLELVLRKPA